MDNNLVIDEFSLSGQVALITAGANGLGFGVATELAKCGAHVHIWDCDEDALSKSKEALQKQGFEATVQKVNLLHAGDTADAFAKLVAQSKRIDVLVNNAGGSLHTPFRFLEESETDWSRVFDLNLMATVRLTKLALPSMQANGYGRIINLGSKAGRYGSLFAGANYVAAKGAIHALTLQIAQEFGPFGITCNAICPGAIMTPRVKGLLKERQSPEERQRVLETIPVRRHGEVEDVARAVRFFASKRAGFITGSLLDVNGGQVMST